MTVKIAVVTDPSSTPVKVRQFGSGTSIEVDENYLNTVRLGDEVLIDVGDRVILFSRSGGDAPASGSIVASDLLVPGSIEREMIVNDAIDRSKIAQGEVTRALIEIDAIDGTKIADDAITAPKIAANQILGHHIVAESIDASHIAAFSISAINIAAKTITADQIAARTITADKIVLTSITAYEMATNSIQASSIIANAVTAAKMEVTMNFIAGSVMESTTYTPGSAGWQINADGSAEFDNVTVRGALGSGTIDIGGADATSFHVDSSGAMWLGDASFGSAPFSVTNAGVALMTGASILGATTIFGDLEVFGAATIFGGFTGGSAGYEFKANGVAEMNELTVNSGVYVGGSISGSSIDIGGADSTSFHVDTSGALWLGNSAFSGAPFRVSNSGDVRMDDGELTGDLIMSGSGAIYSDNVVPRVWIDDAAVPTEVSTAVGMSGSLHTSEGAKGFVGFGDANATPTSTSGKYFYCQAPKPSGGTAGRMTISMRHHTSNSFCELGVANGSFFVRGNWNDSTEYFIANSKGISAGASRIVAFSAEEFAEFDDYIFFDNSTGIFWFIADGGTYASRDEADLGTIKSGEIQLFSHSGSSTTGIQLAGEFNGATGDRLTITATSGGNVAQMDAGGVYSHDLNGLTLRDVQVAVTSNLLGWDSSTIKYKEAIRTMDLDEELSRVLQLRPVRYKPKKNALTEEANETPKVNVGLIAEEIVDLYPEVTYFDPDPDNPGEMMPVGIEYKKLIAPVIAGVQALHSRIETLESRLRILEAA